MDLPQKRARQRRVVTLRLKVSGVEVVGVEGSPRKGQGRLDETKTTSLFERRSPDLQYKLKKD